MTNKKESMSEQTKQKPWWKSYSYAPKDYSDEYFVVCFSITSMEREKTGLEPRINFSKRKEFKSNGINSDHKKKADQYFDKLYDDFRNGNEMFCIEGKLITEMNKENFSMVLLNYYACDENHNMLYYLFTLDDWWFYYNTEIAEIDDPDEADLFPDDGSLEFPEGL